MVQSTAQVRRMSAEELSSSSTNGAELPDKALWYEQDRTGDIVPVYDDSAEKMPSLTM